MRSNDIDYLSSCGNRQPFKVIFIRDKRIYVFFAIGVVFWAVSVSMGQAQNLLRMPESVVYDSQHHRYLASSYTTGSIVAIDTSGQQSYFVQNQYCRNGLHIAGNVVYAACIDQGVKGFCLDDASQVAQINIGGMINLNDITSDTSGNLYVSDVNGSKIYRIKTSDYSYTTFVDCGYTPPNGLYFDAPHNRILVAAYMISAPIMQVSLRDSSLTDIINTGYNELDGITQDNQGNIYFSTWQTQSIYRYDSLFSEEPEFIYHNANGPADIFFNKALNVLAIPVMYSNQVVFLEYPTIINQPDESNLPKEIGQSYCYPNPFNNSTSICFWLAKDSDALIEIYDILGRKVSTSNNHSLIAGFNQIMWQANSCPSGMYFFKIQAGDYSEIGKMILLK